MAAGDAISGTVVAEPGGKGELSGYVVEIDKKKTSVVDRVLKLTAPSANSLTILLKDSTGKQLGRSVVPVQPPTPATSNGFVLPTLGQQGRPVVITGPFDGNAANTTCTMGGESAEILAESPRQLVVSSPTNVTGQTQITVTENNQTTKAPFRNLGVNLSAPKTNLMKGENTTLTIQVSGLEGIRQDVPLDLSCSGVVKMDGGNVQNIQISPSDVQPNGNAIFNRSLTGVQAGAFNVNATVQVIPISNLSGSILHVESSPNGGGGVWQVKVKMPDGRIVTIYIRSANKPNIKFCDWIKLGDVTSENGTLYVDGVEKVDPPKPPEPPKTDPPKTDPPKSDPPKSPSTDKPVADAKPPCNDGDTSTIGVERKMFEVLDPKGEVIVRLYTDKEGSADAAKNMAEFWRRIATAGGLLDYLPEGSGAGAGAAEWLFEYLETGADILDALAKSRLKNKAVGEVNVEIYIDTKKITAACITYDICINKSWVRKKKSEQSEERGALRASKKLTKGGSGWEQVSDPSTHTFDPVKAEKWAAGFLKDKVNILKGGGEGLGSFIKNCQ